MEEIYFAAVLVLGILAQWLAWRCRLPSILLLLAFGALLGEYGRREFVPDEVLFPLVSLAVGVILFEGGMSLQLRELRESGAAVLGLVTVGAVITWLLSTMAARWLLGIDIRVAAVIGGILVVTGPTVVGPLLRLIRPSRRIAATVKWEGIVIDPVGAVFALLAFEALGAHDESVVLSSLSAIAQTVGIGVIVGLLASTLLVQLLKRFLIPDFLHSPAFLAISVAAFTLSNLLRPESGLLAVTVMGIALANQHTVTIKHVIAFKENLQVLLIACLFIVLGSRVDVRDVMALGWPVVAFLFVLIFVIRPLAVWVSTWGTALAWRERVFLAFLAPRGIVAAAVASVFSLEAVHAIESGHWTLAPTAVHSLEQMTPIVFFCIGSTVAFYGLLSPVLARRLGLSEASPQGLLLAGASPWARELGVILKNAGKQVMLIDTNFSNVTAARMDGLDAHCASILAEYVHEEIDMAGLGRLLAMTPNDEVNTLAASEFSHLFGRRNIYQLVPRGPNAGRREQIAEHLRGRLLFSTDLDFEELTRRFDRGAKLKHTHLSEEFPLEAFLEKYGEAPWLVLLTAGGEIDVVTTNHTRTPQPGDSIVFLLDAEGDRIYDDDDDGGAA